MGNMVTAVAHLLKRARLHPASRLPPVRWLSHGRLAYHRRAGRPIAHFLHQPKTGGTAIKVALEPWRSAGPYRVEMYGHDVTLRMIPQGDKFWFFVRHPIARFVSGFNSRRPGRTTRNRVVRGDIELAVYRQFPDANALATALSSEDPEPLALARAAMQVNPHLRFRLADSFESPDYLRSRLTDALMIGSQEHFEEDFARLASLLGLDGRAVLPRDPVAANVTRGFADATLNEQAWANLRRWYADDIAFYETCIEMREAMTDTMSRHLSATDDSYTPGQPLYSTQAPEKYSL